MSLIAHYKLNDNAANTIVVDSTGNHNGVASVDTNTAGFSEAGKINEALNMDSTRFVTISSHADFSFGDGSNDSPFSIATWIFVTDSGNIKYIITKTINDVNGEWGMKLDASERVVFSLTAIDGQRLTVNSSSLNSDLGWHHAVMTYDGSGDEEGLNIYIDGDLDNFSKSKATYVAMTAGALDVVIGARNNGEVTFQDKIDDVRIYSEELSQAEVTALFNGGTGTESNLIFVSGSFNSTSTFSGSVKVTRDVSGSFNVQSTITGAVKVTRTISGSFAGVSSFSGDAGIIKYIAGSFAGAFAFIGTLSRLWEPKSDVTTASWASPSESTESSWREPSKTNDVTWTGV